MHVSLDKLHYPTTVWYNHDKSLGIQINIYFLDRFISHYIKFHKCLEIIERKRCGCLLVRFNNHNNLFHNTKRVHNLTRLRKNKKRCTFNHGIWLPRSCAFACILFNEDSLPVINGEAARTKKINPFFKIPVNRPFLFE